MKNKRLSRLVNLGMAVLLVSAMVSGIFAGEVYGDAMEQESNIPEMKTTAVWTDEENFRAELAVEITGLKEWMDAYNKREDAKSEEEEEKQSEKSEVSEKPEDQTEKNGTPEISEDQLENNGPTEKPEEQPEKSGIPGISEEQSGESEKEFLEETAKESSEASAEKPVKESSQKYPEETSKDFSEESPEEFSETRSEETAKEAEADVIAEISPYRPTCRRMTIAGVTEDSSEKMYAAGKVYAAGMVDAAETVYVAEMVKAVKSVTDVRSVSEKFFGSNQEESTELILDAWISQYFYVPEEELPENCSSRILMLPGEEEEPVAVTEVVWIFPEEEIVDKSSVSIPLILKEEYRYCEKVRQLEVLVKTEENGSIENPTEETEKSTGGLTLSVSGESQPEILLTEINPVFLETPVTMADYTISVKTDKENPKAGETLSYMVTVTNTGSQPLPLITLESSLSPSELPCSWSSEEGQETDVTGRTVILTDLKPGEIRQAACRVKLPEDQSEPVVNRITASAQKASDSETLLVRDVTLKTAVTPLKVDFAVSKSADRTVAGPGDTITYQICIRNTGERTLHSVLSTERFQMENIQAQFVKKDGVLLSSDKTQALITEIPPGEVFSLDAVVTLPEDLKSGELLNQVLVKTRETGDKVVQTTAAVQILEMTPTPSPENASADEQGGTENTSENSGYQALDAPKTSDDSNPAFWLIMLGTAFFASAGIWGYHQFRKKQ